MWNLLLLLMSNFKLRRVTYIIPTGCVGNNSVSLWKSLCCSPGLMWCREACHTLFCSWYIPRCSDMDVFSEYFTAFASFVGASVTLKNLSDFQNTYISELKLSWVYDLFPGNTPGLTWRWRLLFLLVLGLSVHIIQDYIFLVSNTEYEKFLWMKASKHCSHWFPFYFLKLFILCWGLAN